MPDNNYPYNRRFSGIKAADWATLGTPTTGGMVHVFPIAWPTGGKLIYSNIGEYGGGGLETCCTPLQSKQQDLSFEMPLLYEDHWILRMLTSLFGLYANSTSSGASVHTISWKSGLTAANIAALVHTFAFDEGDEAKKGNFIAQSGTLKIADGIPKLEVSFIGNKIEAVAQPTVTYTSPCGVGTFTLSNFKVYINAAGGADFVAGDEVVCNNLEIGIERGYNVDEYQTGQTYIPQPTEPTVAKMTVKFGQVLKDSTNKAWWTAMNAGTYYKMKIFIDSGVEIGSTGVKYSICFFIPELRFNEDGAAFGSDTTTFTADMMVTKPDSNPTGMASTLPYCIVTNEIAALTGYPSS